MFSIGIDPGLHGATVIIDENYRLVKYYDTQLIQNKTGKNEYRAIDMLATMVDVGNLADTAMCRIWIEAQQAMPILRLKNKAGEYEEKKQGTVSAFRTGYGFGLWIGLIVSTGIPYEIVHPRTWTKEMLRDVPAGDGKFRALTKCQRLYPNLPLTKPRGTVLSMDGRADAALIAHFGMMKMKGNL